MSKVLITESNLHDIANAIRSKSESTEVYRPGDMAAAILAIPTGGTSTLVSKTITANGTYDAEDDNADGYSEVTVNVPAPQPNLQSKTATENGTVTPDAGYDGLSSVVVNVSGGGGDVYAFLHVIYLPGDVVTATDGTTTLTGDDSGNAIFAIPNAGEWTVAAGSKSQTINLSNYGTAQIVSLLVIVSLVPVLTSLTGSNGQVIYNNNVTFNWSSANDVWKAFDGNTSSYGEYKGENQSGFWVGYQFNSSVYVDNVEFYGSNYARSDDFLCVVEIMQDGAWVSVGAFNQAGMDVTVKKVQVEQMTNAVRIRSDTIKTPGHNWFIKEIVINGAELS